MFSLRAKARAIAVAGLAVVSVLLPAGSAMAASTGTAVHIVPNAAPLVFPEPEFVCANGGAGLCLQQNTHAGSLVANDVMLVGSTSEAHQQWAWASQGATVAHKLPPFTNSSLLNAVAGGRQFGQWMTEDSANGSVPTAICMAYLSDGDIGMVNCSNSAGGINTGTLWVLTGSGRMVNVLESSNTGFLQFLNSSGKDGGNPFLMGTDGALVPNACPAACWGPFAG